MRLFRLKSPHDRDIAQLAVPALGTLVAEPLYVLADTVIVGHIGTNELAGLALASTVLLTVHGLMIFLAYGTTATVARLTGAGEDEESAKVSSQALWAALALGTMFAALMVVFSTQLLEILGANGAVLDAGNRYLRISAVGMPFLLLAIAGAGSFHGRQNARLPLLIAVGSALANLGIEVVLIFGLGYGIGASALATVIAQVGAALAFGSRLLPWAKSFGISLAPDWARIRAIVVAGQPLILRTIGLRGSFTLATAVAARIGVVEVAAHQVGFQVWSTMALALDAVAIAGQSLTGKWLGSGDTDRARDAARRMIEIDVGVGTATGVLIIIARWPLAHAFSTDPVVVSTIAALLVWVAIAEPVNGYVFALDGILIGAGDFVYLGRAMFGAAAAFGVALTIVAITGAGLTWLWLSLIGFMLLRAATLWWRWRGDHWVVTGA